MRILIVAFCPLIPELGAGQMALNLAGALRQRGHDIVCWWPGEPPRGIRWWRHTAWRRRKLAQFVREEGPFDLVDAPPVAVTRRLAALVSVVARSTQPDLRYLWGETKEGLRFLLRRPQRALAGLVHAGYLAALIVLGWHRARAIMCLGSLELAWMRRYLPWLRRRLHVYMNALGDEDRRSLSALRVARVQTKESGTRFLWIGRWRPHKGTRRLVQFLLGWLPAHTQDTVTIAGYGMGAEGDVPSEFVTTGQVRLVQSYTRAELLDLLRSHDAGLFTSVVEGWGLSLNEMLESGMSVFATEAGAVADLRRCCARGLRPFPPPVDFVPGDAETYICGDLYSVTFSWPRIAESYEALIMRLVLAPSRSLTRA
jgi:glycosyltransferase involved in cell wall biosynthesis